MGLFGAQNKGRGRAVLITVGFLVILVVGRSYLTIDNMRGQRERAESFVKTHPVGAPVVCCCMLSIILACSLPGEMFLTAMCGVLLSPWAVAVGTAWLAHIIGGIVNFTILRIAWYGSPPSFWKKKTPVPPPLPTTNPDREEPPSPKSKEWLAWMDKKVRHAPSWLLVVLRMVPPLFGPLNAAMAVVDIPLSTYIWTTAAGTLPSQVILTLFARQVVDNLLKQNATPAPTHEASLMYEAEQTATTHNSIWMSFLSPSTGFLPPRIRPWTVPIIVPLVWFTFLFIAGFAWQRWELPASRMWRRHPLPNRYGRSGGILL